MDGEKMLNANKDIDVSKEELGTVSLYKGREVSKGKRIGNI